MDIILRILNRATGEGIFIDASLKAHNNDEVISLIKKQRINNLSLVKRSKKTFIKSKPNTKKADNISQKTISFIELVFFYKNYSKITSNQELIRYDALRKKQQKNNYIIIRDNKGDFVSTKTNEAIKNHINKFKDAILKAANEQKIDPFLLGAILIDEYCRMGWDDWADWLGALGMRDTSVGIAQIKLSTAREIIRKGYYNPAPGKINNKSHPAQIWSYLNSPERSVYFCAAAIRLSIEYWKKKKIDISRRNNILAYLYSAGYTKDVKAATTKRCRQISTEFYQMARGVIS